mmetsp:Transcript_102915/g.182803  ORF Transcript_102915/g.182803 Transcript_102915/m.182803 type:complete len:669 (-) Transcript_102915:186-2192(-)
MAAKEAEDGDQEDNKLDGIPLSWSAEEREQVIRRMKEQNSGLGLPDLLYHVPMLVRDSLDNVIEESEALETMLDSIRHTARKLEDDAWTRFQHLTVDRIHHEDIKAHGSLMSQVEPTWKTFVQKPKKSKVTMIYLFMGTDPPTPWLADFFSKLGWLGVCICKQAPASGNEDALDHVKINLSSRSSESVVDALAGPGGGMVPSPKNFHLAYINVLLKDAEQAGSDSEEEEEALPDKPPETLQGYGKVGLTRHGQDRRLLRALRNSLRVTLRRLHDEGCLILCWPGLPLHPILFWLTSVLRELFLRVHVITPDSALSFEIYVLAVGFKKAKAEDERPGAFGGMELFSFLYNNYRGENLDDVIYWTLSGESELHEVSVGAGGMGVVQGYDHLWKKFSEKYSDLAGEFGFKMPVSLTTTPQPQGKKGKKEKPGKKTKDKMESSSPSKEDQSGSNEPTAEEAAAPEGAVAAEPEKPPSAEQMQEAAPPSQPVPAALPPSQGSKGPKLKAKKSSKEKVEQEADAKEPSPVVPPAAAGQEPPAPSTAGSPEVAPPAEAAVSAESGALPGGPRRKNGTSRRRVPAKEKAKAAWQLADEQPVEEFQHDVPRKKAWRLNRSVPDLASTLGAAPGNKFRLGPDYEELAKSWNFVETALQVAKAGRMWRKTDSGPKTAWA